MRVVVAVLTLACVASACGGSGREHPRVWVLLGDAERDRGSRLLRSDDGGASWSEPLPLPAGIELTAIAFRTRDRGFGVTRRGEVLATSNGGGSWMTVLPPVLVNDGDAVTTIAVSPAGHVVAGGQIALDPAFFPRPLAIISDDDGQTWTTLAMQAGIGPVRRVCSTTEGDVLVAFARPVRGSDVYELAVSRPEDRALTATSVPATEPEPRRGSAIGCVGEGQFWTAGFLQRSETSPSYSSVWTSPDAALTWDNRGASLPEDAKLLDVTFSDPEHGWLASGSSLYRTTDGGVTWTPKNMPVAGLYDEVRIAAASSADVMLIMRASGEPIGLISADAGRTWRILSLPRSSRGIVAWSFQR